MPLAHLAKIDFAAVYAVYAALVLGCLLCLWSIAARVARVRGGDNGARATGSLMSCGSEATIGSLCVAGIVSDNEQIVGLALTSFAALLGFALWSDRRRGSSDGWPARPGPRFGNTRGERLIRAGAVCLVPLAALWEHFVVNGAHFAPPEAKQAVIFAAAALTAAGAMLLEFVFDATSSESMRE